MSDKLMHSDGREFVPLPESLYGALEALVTAPSAQTMAAVLREIRAYGAAIAKAEGATNV
jgi:hypothetical protein